MKEKKLLVKRADDHKLAGGGDNGRLDSNNSLLLHESASSLRVEDCNMMITSDRDSVDQRSRHGKPSL